MCNLWTFWEEVLRAAGACLSDRHTEQWKTLLSCCAVRSPVNSSYLTSVLCLCCLVWVTPIPSQIPSQCSLNACQCGGRQNAQWKQLWIPCWETTVRSVEASFSQHQKSSLWFHSSAPRTCNWQSTIYEKMQNLVYQKRLGWTLRLVCCSLSSSTFRDVFTVMFTRGIVMLDEGARAPHFPGRWASGKMGLRAPQGSLFGIDNVWHKTLNIP